MEDYLHYHIPTAIRPRGRAVKNEETGETITTMVLPYEPAIEAKQRIVVYRMVFLKRGVLVENPQIRVKNSHSK